MDSDYSDEEVVENPTFKAAYNLEPLHHNQRLRWDHQVRLIGEKVFDPQIHLCEKCQYPILVYGRMLPCKHVFCLDCAKKYEKLCPRCESRVVRIEQSALGTVFICTHGAPKHSISGCRRTYLSKRDLQAHIGHRHSIKPPSSSAVDRGVLEEKLPSSTHHQSQQQQQQQQHHISSTYERHESSRDRDRDRDRDRERDRDRGDRERGDRERERDSRGEPRGAACGERGERTSEQSVYRPLDPPPPSINTGHPPPPPIAAHLQQPPPSPAMRHPPPALQLQHNPLRMAMPPMQQQAPPVATTMESYVTTPLQAMGVGVSGAGASRTNQNLITVPIQDEVDTYSTTRGGRESDRSTYGAVPHSMASHLQSAPPSSYSNPPPHMGMPPPGVPPQPFNPTGLVGVGRVAFSTAPLVQAVAHLASVTHALSQQRAHMVGNPPPPQRLNLPPPPRGSVPPVSTPSRFPHGGQQPFGASSSPMQHWSGAPRQGQNQGQRPPSDNSNYGQYY